MEPGLLALWLLRMLRIVKGEWDMFLGEYDGRIWDRPNQLYSPYHISLFWLCLRGISSPSANGHQMLANSLENDGN